MDVRCIKILQLQYLLHSGIDNKQSVQYMYDLRELIKNAPSPKPKYCSFDIIDDLENKIIFNFVNNNESFNIDKEIELILS